MGLLRRRKQANSALLQYQEHMQEALRRLSIARLQIGEATTIEELDIGKANLQMAFAEVQRVVRLAKSEAGMPVRPLEEVEEQYHQLMRRFRGNHQVTSHLPVAESG